LARPATGNASSTAETVRTTTVLSYDQQRQLDLLDAQTSFEDPHFASGLGAGRPRRPRQYRTWQTIVELLTAIAAIALAASFGTVVAVVVGATTLAALTVAWSRRRLRLDRPCPLTHT
jgi:hypothetical protein